MRRSKMRMMLGAGLGIVLVAAAAMVLLAPLQGQVRAAGGGMMGGMMSGEGRGMRDMMRGMMGGMLPPGIAPSQLPEPQSAGARLLDRYCTQCHELPGPGLHTAAEWPAVVGRMNARMQMMGGGMMKGCMMSVAAPTRGELQTILGYLQEHAQRPLDPSAVPDLDSPAGRTFAATCAQCHALPNPGQHSAAEWPAVVGRMKGHMAAMGKPVPDDARSGAIVGFLQRHGRQ